MGQVQGKIALMTGAASGIGAACADLVIDGGMTGGRVLRPPPK